MGRVFLASTGVGGGTACCDDDDDDKDDDDDVKWWSVRPAQVLVVGLLAVKRAKPRLKFCTKHRLLVPFRPLSPPRPDCAADFINATEFAENPDTAGLKLEIHFFLVGIKFKVGHEWRWGCVGSKIHKYKNTNTQIQEYKYTKTIFTNTNIMKVGHGWRCRNMICCFPSFGVLLIQQRSKCWFGLNDATNYKSTAASVATALRRTHIWFPPES